jgi:maltose/moltooligosaccharide transporter
MSQRNKPVPKKPIMSIGQLLNMNLGFLGIQFGFALQTGNSSRILETFGANVEHLTCYRALQ